jgi:predicted DNA-binding transcriptional regulator AlpA
MNYPDLMTTKDISTLLGVCHRHCVERIMKRPDFPQPKVNLSRRLKRWSRTDVLKWAGLK